MARQRMINPNIWQSEDFSKLSTLAKLVFIGMFSLADDEGKGRAKPVYLKSVIFPYDDGMRLTDIEKALSEIGSNMSVTFYASNGNQYYRMDNWKKWQKVEKPSESIIPDPDNHGAQEGGETGTGAFGDDSPNVPRTVGDDSRLREKKGKEEKRNENDAPARGGETATRYFADAGLDALFAEFLELRKKLKAVNSDKAIAMLVNELNRHDGDDIKTAKINRSIVSSWKDVYPLKEHEMQEIIKNRQTAKPNKPKIEEVL